MPARRILLGFYFEEFLAVGGAEALGRVVGLSRAAWKDWRPANWAEYVKVLPGLEAIPEVGEVEVGTFSVEKAIALKPDVAILGDWQVKGLGTAAERLAAAGIPVVVIDYHAEQPARHAASTRLLGQVLGEEARAARLAGEYEAAITALRDSISAARLPRPRIYVELGSKGPGEQGPSYGDYMWGALAALAGGSNIGRGVIATWGPMAAETVLASRPEVIAIAGSEWRRHPTAQLMGQGVAAEEARARLRGFLARPGWNALPAVREGRVHAVYQGASRTLADFASLQYLAKALYPELFAGLDPQAEYLAWHARWLPIRPQGSFMLGLA
ncbi:iron ABC transporter substrate-binding protein [Roseomonas sp. M0104]|uniref:Iron ABC transporter substrate-binding protein n=1 Tax=Teichococcus coralli TaxID=2545983 RepID=A0A845BIE9_9PROT|nr:iron ABC transporter substrate-binding protein [Pseudoroseomonas coralli]